MLETKSLNKFLNDLQDTEDIKKDINNGLQSIGKISYDQAYADCPVDTGNLRDHIELDTSDLSMTLGVSGVDYAEYVNDNEKFLQFSEEETHRKIEDLFYQSVEKHVRKSANG